CQASLSGTVTIDVSPSPEATIAGDTTICQFGPGATITFTNPENEAITLTYAINGGAPQIINVPANGTSNIVAPSDVAGTFTYVLISAEFQTPPSCPRIINDTVVITVTPAPQ